MAGDGKDVGGFGAWLGRVARGMERTETDEIWDYLRIFEKELRAQRERLDRLDLRASAEEAR